MTSRQARRERREAERKTEKLAHKVEKAAAALPRPTLPASEPAAGFVSHRAEINRRNAENSTGPRTPRGKLASSRNSLKHGLSTGQVIVPGEDPAAFESLRRDLMDEHRPANATEDLLVNEMAQSYWLAQRAIRLQNECFTGDGVDEKRLALFLRYQITHDRTFHKALDTLIRLKKASPGGFVSQQLAKSAPASGFVSYAAPASPSEARFVRQNDQFASPPAA